MKEDFAYNKAVGLRLFTARKELKMTRVELGNKVDLHESTIKRYEDGEIKSLDIEKIQTFAKALQKPPAYLLGWDWDVHNMTLSDMEANVITAYREKQDRQHTVNLILGVWDNPHPQDEKVGPSLLRLNQIYLALDENGRKAVDSMMENVYGRCAVSPEENSNQ